MTEPHVLSIDPGETTGLAWAPTTLFLPGSVDRRMANLVQHRQISGPLTQQTDQLLLLIRKEQVSVVVMESWRLVPGVALRGKATLAPVKLDAMLTYAMHNKWFPIPIMYQSASQGKSVITDQRLKALGMWWRGEEHARDATRHLVTFIRTVRRGKFGDQFMSAHTAAT